MSDEFVKPSETRAADDKFNAEELLGSLLLFYPKEHVTGVQTEHYGEKDAVRAHVVVLDGPVAGGVLYDTLIFPGVLIGQLKGAIGSKVLGRLTQGEPKGGGKPPWKLADFTEADLPAARAYTSANPNGPQPTAHQQQFSQPAGAPSAHDPWAGMNAPPAPPQQQQWAPPPQQPVPQQQQWAPPPQQQSWQQQMQAAPQPPAGDPPVTQANPALAEFLRTKGVAGVESLTLGQAQQIAASY